MNETGITFSWLWLGATILGALIGFVIGEVIERIFPSVWARIGRRRKPPLKMQKSNSTCLKISRANVVK